MMDFLQTIMVADDFARNAYAWASNEAGHLALGLVITGGFLLTAPRLFSLAASLMLYAAFEGVQGWASGFDLRDSANDWLAWAFGAGFALAFVRRSWAAWLLLLAGAMIGLFRGVKRRE